MFKAVVLILLLACLFFTSFSQVRITHAVKMATTVRIDGVLDDSAWMNVPVATDFITNTPIYGKPSSCKTEVKVVYDNTAIYIGAYIYDDPALIRRQFTSRDQEKFSDADYFAVFIDTYKDRQNAFQFLVTSRNVQTDARVSPLAQTEFGTYGDRSWDAVWDSKISFRDDGWMVEIKIPYSSIRFPRKAEQEWGIQFLRFIRRLNETSFWDPVDPSISGFVNQFGDLSGLNNLIPPLRLSFSPYVSGGYRGVPGMNKYQNEWLRSGGMDVKYGISESFTLDATLIPDFGQVISDNVVNNISPFEIQFRENRPFFTEGTEIFNKAGIFYSRRVGSTPTRHSEINERTEGGDLMNYTVIKNPEVTRLYNAIKFSGRTRNKLGIGIFNAVTEPVHAKLRNISTGADSLVLTEPLANYNVIVLDQALKNRSYISFTNTNVLRNGNERDANVTAVDLALYDKQNKFGFLLSPRYSKIFDTAGGYGGFMNHIQFGKVSGKLQYSISNALVTDKYDHNDMGFLLSPNEFSSKATVSYNIFQETRGFLNQQYTLALNQSYLFKQFEYQKTTILGTVFWVFKNFWDLTLHTEVQPRWFNDYFELRTPEDIRETPRKVLKKASNYFIGMSGSSDSRKKFFGNWAFGFAESPLPDDPYHYITLGARYRFSDRFSLDISCRRQHDHGQFGYAFMRDPGTKEPILARRKYTDIVSVISGIYNFTSRMNITFRARHYWNRILNTNLYDVNAIGYWKERFDLNPSDYNTNYNAFNLDVFYTWDFRLGSRIIIGWKNWLGKDFEYTISGVDHPKYPNNVREVFATPHGNELTVRFIYYLDYQQLKKKQ